MSLNATDACRPVAGKNANCLIAREAAGPNGSGDDRAGPLDRERAIDGQSKQIVVGARDDRARKIEKRGTKLGNAARRVRATWR